jgi:hypothetical protein
MTAAGLKELDALLSAGDSSGVWRFVGVSGLIVGHPSSTSGTFRGRPVLASDAHAALIPRLPLPLAQLLRRAHNAKTPLERHLTAYYLWECALKLLGSAAVVDYAELAEHDSVLVDVLGHLARPTVGHWWEITRSSSRMATNSMITSRSSMLPGRQWPCLAPLPHGTEHPTANCVRCSHGVSQLHRPLG